MNTRYETAVQLQTALRYAEHGLAVLPCSGSGKGPLIGGFTQATAPGRHAIRRFWIRWPDANVAVRTGAVSGVTVIDADTFDSAPFVERFGHSPIVVRTPSNGRHFWFRHSRERCGSLARLGLRGDLRGDGGYVVVPPSRIGTNGYEFERGGLDCLCDLPALPAGALDTGQRVNDALPHVGERNVALFAFAREVAAESDTLEEVERRCLNFNDQIAPPLPEAEVVKTSRSAWRYRVEGRLLLPGCEATAVKTASTFELLAGNPDANALYDKLVLTWGWTNAAYPVSPGCMVDADTMPGWSKRRYRQARSYLLKVGLLAVIHQGAGRGDPSLFTHKKKGVRIDP